MQDFCMNRKNFKRQSKQTRYLFKKTTMNGIIVEPVWKLPGRGRGRSGACTVISQSDIIIHQYGNGRSQQPGLNDISL